jgi:hypothetical protein
MTANRTLSKLVLPMMALPVILGAALFYLRPQDARTWAIAMIVLPAAGLVRAKVMRTENTVEAQKAISGALIFVSMLVSVTLAAPLAAALGLIDDALAHKIAIRAASVFAGVFLVLRGNRLPKMLTPLADTRCDPATMQTLQRRTGWAYVLAGFTITVLWIVLPVHLAAPIGAAVIVAGILAPTIIMRSYAKGRVGTPSP